MADDERAARMTAGAPRNLGQAALCLILCVLLIAAAPPRPDVSQRSFPTPDAAVTALVDADKAGDPAALGAVLGPGSERLARSGDPTKDEERQRFLDAYHTLTPDDEQRMALHVGQDDWPPPIPLVQHNGQWRFDSRQGAQHTC